MPVPIPHVGGPLFQITLVPRVQVCLHQRGERQPALQDQIGVLAGGNLGSGGIGSVPVHLAWRTQIDLGGTGTHFALHQVIRRGQEARARRAGIENIGGPPAQAAQAALVGIEVARIDPVGERVAELIDEVIAESFQRVGFLSLRIESGRADVALAQEQSGGAHGIRICHQHFQESVGLGSGRRIRWRSGIRRNRSIGARAGSSEERDRQRGERDMRHLLLPT